ncbi:MAG: VWA domain-containing protein [Candidatus Korarchaeota archaeon]
MELEVIKGGDINGVAYVNPNTASSLGVYDGSIIVFEDQTTGNFGGAPIFTSKDVPAEKIKIDSTLVESCGIDEGFVVEVRKYAGKVLPLRRVVLGIEPAGGASPEETFKAAHENAQHLRRLLDKRVIFKKMRIRWPDINAYISIEDTEPALQGQEFAIINWPELERADLIALGPAMTFNAILLIDISGSMATKDMKVVNIAPAREGIKSILDTPYIRDFLTNFEENTEVKRRWGAAFASLLYLAEKVGRGYGEKVAVVPYHDEAYILEFGGKPYFDASTDKLEEIAETIIANIAEQTGGYTNITDALRKADKVMKRFKDDKPVMVVLLTDGYPQGVDTEEQVADFVEKNFAPLKDIVLYVIGIGGEVNEVLMRDISAMTGGAYFHAADLGLLLKFYSELARGMTKAVHAKRQTGAAAGSG